MGALFYFLVTFCIFYLHNSKIFRIFAQFFVCSMKNSRIISLLILGIYACTACMSMHAQTITRLSPDNHSFISVWGGLGYAGLVPDKKDVGKMNGGGLEVGVGYKLLYNKFLFSVGVDADFAVLKADWEDATFKRNMMDTEGDQFVLNATLSDRMDVAKRMNVNVPILFGAEFNRIYFLAGAKVGLDMYGRDKTTSVLNTSATYERFPKEFEDMENHGLYKNKAVKGEDMKLSLSPKVSGYAELGWRLDNRERHYTYHQRVKMRYYLAVYAEYGLLARAISHQDDSRFDLSQTYSENLEFEVTPEYLSKELAGMKLRDLNIGVKFVANFEMPQKKACVTCNDRKK